MKKTQTRENKQNYMSENVKKVLEEPLRQPVRTAVSNDRFVTGIPGAQSVQTTASRSGMIFDLIFHSFRITKPTSNTS